MADWRSQEMKQSSGGKSGFTASQLYSFVLFVCCHFLLGWVPSNPIYVFGMFHSWPEKKKNQCFDISLFPPLLNTKAPGLLNKQICGHS